MKQYAPWKFPTDFQGLFFGRERIPEQIFVPDTEDLFLLILILHS
jgi:hypothetical protein